MLRLLEHVLLAAPSQRGAPHLLCLAQRNGTSWIELERLGAIESRQKIDDVVEGPHHVFAHFGVGQIPAALLLDEMEDALPGFRVRDIYHPAKDPPVGWRAEDG